VRTTRLRSGLALTCALIVAAASGGQSSLQAAPADFTRYHTFAELSAALKAAVTAHADLAKLVSIGKTREGRDIWAVEIAKASGPPVDTRPGLLIAAAFEGDHLIGSELALYIVDYLLDFVPMQDLVQEMVKREGAARPPEPGAHRGRGRRPTPSRSPRAPRRPGHAGCAPRRAPAAR